MNAGSAQMMNDSGTGTAGRISPAVPGAVEADAVPRRDGGERERRGRR